MTQQNHICLKSLQYKYTREKENQYNHNQLNNTRRNDIEHDAIRFSMMALSKMAFRIRTTGKVTFSIKDTPQNDIQHNDI